MDRPNEADPKPEFETTARAVIDLVKDLGHTEHIDTPDNFDFNSCHLTAMPTNREIKEVTDRHRAAMQYLKPARRKGTATMHDMPSLIAWANRFKGDTSALFATPSKQEPRMTCVADYHASGPIDPLDPTGDPSARHCHHRAIYKFPLSDEWKAWMAIDGKGQEKDDLGEFIETNAKDIMDPTPAIIKMEVANKNNDWENRLITTAQQIDGRFGQLRQLLALSKQFQVYETSDLAVSTNRDTGETNVQFTSEHKDATGKPLNLPNLIIICIPVFEGGPLYRMPVRFRYRKTGGNIKFILSIYNPEKAFKASFDEAAKQMKEATDLPLFMGTPES